MPQVESVSKTNLYYFIFENQKIYCVSCYSVENLRNIGDALNLDNPTINRVDELRKLYLLNHITP
jgi:hypothetical protein